MSDSDTDSAYYSIPDNQDMSDSYTPDSPSPVSGPQAPGPKLENPLRKYIRIRIDLDACTGLRLKTYPWWWENAGRRGSWHLEFELISHPTNDGFACSSKVYEGKGSLRGIVQWDETLYIDGWELSFIFIQLWREDVSNDYVAGICISVDDLLTKSAITLLPTYESMRSETAYTLFLSTSRVPDGCDGKTSRLNPVEEIQRDDIHIGQRMRSSSWNTVSCQLFSFTATLSVQLSQTDSWDIHGLFCIQSHNFEAFQNCQGMQSHHPQIDELVTSMGRTVNVLRQSPGVLSRPRSHILSGIVLQLFLLTSLMQRLSWGNNGPPLSNEYREEELARLVIIIGTPGPAAGARSTSHGANRYTIFGTIAKDALICALDALAQSSDACSPLKSVAGGLMFFATWADLVSSNREDIRDICERISGLVKYFRFAVVDGAPLTSAHQNTINALAEDISKLNAAVEEVVAERKSRLRRYVSAKQHRKKLEGVARKLEEARGNYTAAVVTLNATSIANVQAHVQAYTILMETTPMYPLGTRRANAATFPYNAASVEEA